MQVTLPTDVRVSAARAVSAIATPVSLPHSPELCVLSYGSGQDSTCILYLLASSKEFRAKYAPKRLLVLFSDTMDEHPETYTHLEETKVFCQEHGIEFVHILPEMGHHRSWQGLREFYRDKSSVGMVGSRLKACTSQLKIVPIYNYLEYHLGREFNLPTGKKTAHKLFAAKYGKIRVLIGLARGEEKRVADPAKEENKWKRDSIEISYPLIDLGMDRGDAQRSIAAFGKKVCPPSNCMICHYQSARELLWHFRFYPESFNDWVEIERKKIENGAGSEKKNTGVYGAKTLPEVLAKAILKYGHMTNAELQYFKMSHGHCTQSRY